MPGTISGNVILRKVRHGSATQVDRRVLERPVEAAHPGLDGQGHEAHAEHDVGDHHGREAEGDVLAQEQLVERCAEHDLGCGQRQHQEDLGDLGAGEAVAGERDRHQGAHDHGDAVTEIAATCRLRMNALGQLGVLERDRPSCRA